MTDQSRSILTDFENASKEHEKEVVIEFGTDRLIKWLGVYALTLSAVVTKISELAANNLACYPGNMTSGPDRAFIEFARDYCWMRARKTNETSSLSCRSMYSDEQIPLENADNLKLFLQWLPYVMLAQAFLVSLPMAYWHFRVGARLVGHLKFMQLLLIEIFERVKTIKSGYYTFEPYDASGSILDGWKPYPDKTDSSASTDGGLSKPADSIVVRVDSDEAGATTPLVSGQSSCSGQAQVEEICSIPTCGESTEKGTPVCEQSAPQQTPQQGATDKPTASTDGGLSKPADSPIVVRVDSDEAGATTPLVSGQSSCSGQAQVEEIRSIPTCGESTEKGTPVCEQSAPQQTPQQGATDKPTAGAKRFRDWCSRMAPWNIADGEMKDRHFFSMLCFENFASLHHLPYILSVFKVCSHKEDKGKIRRVTDKYPLLESMLLIWCDPKNLGDVFLLRVYAHRQLSIAFLSLAMLLTLLAWFFAGVMDDVMLSDTFWCEIPYQNVCLLCTVKRINNTLMLFAVDVTITLIVFALAVWKWLDVRDSYGREAAHFFDVLQKDNNLALQTANYQASKQG